MNEHGRGAGSSKMWGGRFQEAVLPEIDEFCASLPFDRRLYRQDIAGSVAHARMLGRQGIIRPEEAERIVSGLESIMEEIDAGEFPWRPELEDVHMNIEARLTELIGPAGGKVHTARSRNDQVALDMHLYVREAADDLLEGLRSLQEIILGQARAHPQVILPGYTHLQRAQPVRLAHHLLAYFFMFQRDRERLADARKRVNMMPLGAGALAGTTFPIDPHSVARELGFDRVYANSMDAVSDRDFLVEVLSACSLIQVHLSRLGEELVLWSSAEFGFAEMADSVTTGSSIMPQKKNPVVAELLRGKTGRVTGALIALLTMLKGLPLTYNTDMQEDKESTFDALDTVGSSLKVAARLLECTSFRPDRMRQAIEGDYSNATDLADYLARKDVPFREAHRVAGRAVREALSRGVPLQALPLGDLKELHPAFEEDIYQVLAPEAGADRSSPMGTGASRVREQLDLAEELLSTPPGEIQWTEVETPAEGQ